MTKNDAICGDTKVPTQTQKVPTLVGLLLIVYYPSSHARSLFKSVQILAQQHFLNHHLNTPCMGLRMSEPNTIKNYNSDSSRR